MQTVQQTLPSLSNITACIIPIGIDKIIEYEMSIVQQSFKTNSIKMCWLQNWLKFTLRNNWWHVKTDHSQFHYQTQQIQISINLVGSFLATQSFNLIHFCKFPRIDAKSSLVLMSVLYHVKLLNQNIAAVYLEHTCFGHSFMIDCFGEVYVL